MHARVSTSPSTLLNYLPLLLSLLHLLADPNALESSLVPTSPRSVEACFRLGLDPVEMQFHPLTFYKRAGEDEDCSRVRFERNEAVRQVMLLPEGPPAP